eukprot:scaffold105556_cov42-Prasinocladus_malaysianus.AAC.1
MSVRFYHVILRMPELAVHVWCPYHGDFYRGKEGNQDRQIFPTYISVLAVLVFGVSLVLSLRCSSQHVRQKRRAEKQERKAQAQREAAALLEAAVAASPRLRSADPGDPDNKHLGPQVFAKQAAIGSFEEIACNSRTLNCMNSRQSNDLRTNDVYMKPINCRLHAEE